MNVKECFISEKEIRTFTQCVTVNRTAHQYKKLVEARLDVAALLNINTIILSRHI